MKLFIYDIHAKKSLRLEMKQSGKISSTRLLVLPQNLNFDEYSKFRHYFFSDLIASKLNQETLNYPNTLPYTFRPQVRMK